MHLAEVVARFVQDHDLAAEPGVAALSGGPDSVALALALQRCLPKLTLAHVNHQLRGEESTADEAFVRGLPASWDARGLSVEVERCARADKHGNLEAAARRQRYDALAGIARRAGAGWVATGHTADDQAETVLFRLLRGSGLQGLGAMRPCRPLAEGVALVRPLLSVRRADVLAFLAELRQPYREDSSNLDPRFARNRLRHELLPLLQRDHNPAVMDVLNRLAEQAAELHDDLTAMAAEILQAATLPRAGTIVVLGAEALGKARPSVCREAFRLLWQREGWPMDAMGFDEWRRLHDIVIGDVSAWEFPGKVRVRRVGRVVQLSPLAG